MSAALTFQALTGREAMIERVAVAATDPAPDTSRRVADAIAASLGDRDLLSGFACPSDPHRYARHMIYACPKGTFSLMALIWMPGQASPLHAHRAWCAVGVYHGTLTESHFAPRPDGSAAWVQDRRQEAGALSFGEADEQAIHCLANRTSVPAVSIHAYGLSPDRLCAELNRLYVA